MFEYENERMSGGVFVIVVKDEKVLLVKEAKYLRFSLPGGGVDHLEIGTEIVTVTALRETEEEAQIRARLNRLVGIFSLKKDFGLVIVFEGSPIEEFPFEPTEEIKERVWVSLDCFRDPLTIPNEIDIHPAQRNIITQYVRYRDGNKFPIFGTPIDIHNTVSLSSKVSHESVP